MPYIRRYCYAKVEDNKPFMSTAFLHQQSENFAVILQKFKKHSITQPFFTDFFYRQSRCFGVILQKFQRAY